MQKPRGFTLLELLVVISIAAVLTGLAVPSFRDSIRSAESRTAATDFYGDLARARSEAIARNADVSICARDLSNPSVPACQSASSNWENGWVVYAGGSPASPIAIHAELPNQLTLQGVSSPLIFTAAGRVNASATFDLCRGSGDSKGRRLVVSRSGRVVLEQRPC